MSIPHSRVAGGRTAALPMPRWQQRIDGAKAVKRQLALSPRLAGAPVPLPTVGDCLGLCLPVDFPDLPATIPHVEIHAFCNQSGYNGFGNNGSVFDYYLDNSAGKLRYKTLVAPYYTALHPRDHYADTVFPLGQRSAELVREAIEYHRAHGLRFNNVTVDASKDIRATSLLCAGPPNGTGTDGLRPHASTVLGGLMTGGGRSVADFHVGAMSDGLRLGVYCRENAHMLCDFPDLHRAASARTGCCSYCLMSLDGSADGRNPPQFGAYLKYKAGWAQPVMIERGRTLVASAEGNRCFMLQNTSTEYFLIEYRRRAGRDAALPAEGLAIWHVDELGSNSWPDAADASPRRYECVLVQPDGRHDPPDGSPDGDCELFGPSDEPLFVGRRQPSSHWWDGTPSGLQINRIRAVGGGLEFAVA